MGLFSRFAPQRAPVDRTWSERPSTVQISPIGDFPGSAMLGPAAPRRGLFSRPQATETAPEREKMTGAQRMQVLGATLRDIGAGLNGQQGGAIAGLQDAFQGQQEQALKRHAALQKSQQQAQMIQMADDLGMDPRERLIFMADPAGWAKANASRLEAFTLGEGQERHAPGGPVVRNDKTSLGVDGGYGYRLTEDGIDWFAGRGPSYSEAETARHNMAGEGLDASEFDWLREYQGAQLENARGQLDLNRAAHHARVEKGGYGLPGVAQPDNPFASLSTAQLLAALRGGR